MKNKKAFVIVVAMALVLLFAVAAAFYSDSEEKKMTVVTQENANKFVRDYSPTMGSENASVAVVEFLDPECESCRAFYPHVKQLLAQYQGDVKLVVRYAPFHHNSVFVVKILEAARKQDKYWETLELLFQNQPNWGSHHDPKPELIWTYLPEIGLDVEKIKADMNDPKIAAIIQQDIDDGKSLGVRATPSFFVNGHPLTQFGPEFLQQLIDQEVKKAKSRG